MREKELKEILQREYTLDHWKELFKLLFKKVELFNKPESLFEDNERVVTGQQSGLIKLDDGKALAIFEVEVNDSINIVRNRQGLREIAVKYIDQNITHGALVFFYNKKQKDYRFSFIAKWSSLDFETGELVKGETKPKRFTYILGPNEACTTAAKRLLVLMSKRERGEVGIDQLKEAFSVEALNKEFFKNYKYHYDKFWTFLAEAEQSKLLIDPAKEELEDQQKPIRDFVKKLLGRIVFLHFLQKKGWMGCPKGSKSWEGGEPRFMQMLFDDYEQKDKFYSRCLSKLFFETLNTKRTNDAFYIDGLNGKLNGSRVPYLNGGLFDPEKNKALTNIDFPSIFFQELLDFFEQYNFTIDENSPDDHEVGIDPEMLGHIFENLLEENREKGAFYTPKEIVQYMCKESLIEYLGNTFSENEAVEDFIRFHRVSGFFSKRDNAKLLDERLSAIKVCDPAIGSGAFPIGMLQEIFEAKRFIDPFLNTNEHFDPAEVKKSIIQNSIYGVDLEKGAVDIAQLRFWLALVVEEVNPHPLPNLDYKIMQGNSLLEKYEGIDLGKVAMLEEPSVRFVNPQINMYTNQVEDPQLRYGFSEESRSSIKELINDYFKIEDKTEKVRIHKAIDRIVIDHIDKSLEGFENQLLIEIATYEKKLDEKLENLASEAQKQSYLTKSKEAKEIAKRKEQLEQKNQARQNLLKFEETDERPYFLWHLYFMDVFEKGGFDVMIGNPPYIQLQKIKEESDMLKTAGYDTYTRTGDIYCLFYELSFNFLREKGVLTFITSNKWMRGAYGKSLRALFTERNTRKVIDLGPRVFNSATVDTNIYIGRNESSEHKELGITLKERNDLRNLGDTSFVELPDVGEDAWIILDASELNINKAFKAHGKPLIDWEIEINRGVLTGYNEAFLINSEVKEGLISKDERLNDLIHPILKGREINKYVAIPDGYIIFIPWHFPKQDDPLIKGASNEAEEEFRTTYPVLYDYLLSHKEGLSQRNKAETGIRYEWYALQRCAATYSHEFKKEKVIWKRIGSIMRFAYSNEEMYCLDSTCIATGEKIKYLTAVLNSKVGLYQLFKTSPQTGTGDQIISVQALEPLLVHYPEAKTEAKFNLMVDYILFVKSQHESIFEAISNETVSKQLEDVVDQMAYELYFEEHMKDQKIDVLKFINFPDINEANDENEKKALIQKVYYDLTEKDNEIRNRILRSFTRSPDIIKRINDTVIQ